MTLVDVACRALRAPGRVELVRRLRCDESTTWRGVAGACFHAWADSLEAADRAAWSPPANEAVGLALCTAAAHELGQDPRRTPWASAGAPRARGAARGRHAGTIHNDAL